MFPAIFKESQTAGSVPSFIVLYDAASASGKFRNIISPVLCGPQAPQLIPFVSNKRCTALNPLKISKSSREYASCQHLFSILVLPQSQFRQRKHVMILEQVSVFFFRSHKVVYSGCQHTIQLWSCECFSRANEDRFLSATVSSNLIRSALCFHYCVRVS